MKRLFIQSAFVLFAAFSALPAAFAQEHVEIAAAPTVATSSEDSDIIRRVPYVQGESPEIGPNEIAILNPEKTEWTVSKTDWPKPTPLPSLYAAGCRAGCRISAGKDSMFAFFLYFCGILAV